jgi:DNA replication protein DnaC
MSSEKQKSLAPVIATLSCLGIATTTSMLGGTYVAGLAGKAVIDLLGNISGNVASDQLLKINPSNLRQWWKRPIEDISNHDLFKALKQSLVMALRATEQNYIAQFADQGDRYHFKAIQRKIEALCKHIEENFEVEFAEQIDDHKISAFEEGYDAGLFEVFHQFLAIEDLQSHGNDFLPFVEEQLPLNITRAFTEILKTNQRVWVAYQRLLLTDILESNRKTNLDIGEVSEKIDTLCKQIQTIDNCLNGEQEELVGYLWDQFKEAKLYFTQSKKQLDSFQIEVTFLLEQFQQDYLQEMQEQKVYRKESREAHNEILRRLERNENSVDEKELEKDILPKYLQWVIQEYESISLPAIQEKKTKQLIPLERVYVALELTDEATRKDFQYGSQLIKQQIKEEEAACGRRLDEAERGEIRSKVIQKNQTLHSYHAKSVGNGTLNDEEYAGLVSLDKVFQNERHLLILGDPGSGKSTIAKWLTLQLAKAMLKGEEHGSVVVNAEHILGKNQAQEKEVDEIDLGKIRLPILIKIPEYTKYYEEYQFSQSNINQGRGIIDFCGVHLPTVPGLSPEKVQQLIKYFLTTNRAVVFLDGMDEVVKNRDKIIDEIEKFIQYWINLGKKNKRPSRPIDTGGNQVVVTSRVVGYHAAPLRSNIAHVYVREMDDNAIRSFCELWTQQVLKEELSGMDTEEMNKIIHEESEGLQQAIFDKSKPRIKELATNPLLVTILALLYRYQNKQLPKSRVELYEQSINILVGKWKNIHSEGQAITKEELNKILEALAEHIHSSPSEDVTEFEMAEILERELKLIRGYQEDEPVGNIIAGQVENFIKIVKEDVGLLSERGEKLYHFLHRTFQEYLAAKRLVANPQTAIQNIIERLSDPVWREPVLLSVAYANSYWSTKRFNSLVNSLLSAEDSLKDLVPRGILLIATALPDLEKLSLELFKKLVKEFLDAFGDRKGIGRFKPIREAIKTIIDNLRISDRQPAFLEVCGQLLEEPDEYGGGQWALLSLSAKDGWYQVEWVDHLLGHLHEDAAEWDWPIDQILSLVYAKRENKLTNPLLPFRQQLIDNSTFFEHIQDDPNWLRLVIVLYGGLEYDPKVKKHKELEDALYRYSTKQVNMEEEGYSIAVKLDTELGQVNCFKKEKYEFSPFQVHRESPFTRIILRFLATQKQAQDLVPFFYDQWKEGASEDIKAQALLALAALGENVARIIYLIDDDAYETDSALRFLNHLARLERNLSTTFLSMVVRAKKNDNVQKWGWGLLPIEESSHCWSAFCKAASGLGLAPITFFSTNHAQNIYPNEKDLLVTNWSSFVLREAESYAAMIGMSGADPVYSTAVVLDASGKAVKGPNDQYLLDTLCEIPYASNRNNVYSFGWEVPEFWFLPKTEKEKLVFALQVSFGLPEDFYFFREFITVSLWNRMAAYPSLKYFALALFVNRKSSQIVEKLKTDLLGEGPLFNRIIIALDQIEDPYIQFLTAFYLNKQFISPDILDNYLLTAQERITDRKEWFTTYLLLHSKEVQVYIFIASLLRRSSSKYSNTLSILNREEPKTIISSQLAKVTSATDQIFMLVGGASLLEDTERTAAIFQAMDLIPAINNDSDRARSLQYILDRFQSIATDYSFWDQVNASFQNPYWLNRALSKEYVNLFEQQKYIEQEKEHRQERSFFWNVFSLMRMSQELTERFEDGDIDGSLINRILNKRKEKEALGSFLDRNKNGLAINSRNVSLIDQLVAENRTAAAMNILQLLESTEMGDINRVQHWAQHKLPELRLFYNLLYAESGYLNKEIIDAIIEILKSFPDRLKFRAAIAIHGYKVDIGNQNRKFSIKNLGFETLLYLRKKARSLNIIHPNISNTISWFDHNSIYDDPQIIQQVLDLYQSGSEEEKRVALRIFESFERATDEVISEALSVLKSSVNANCWIIWRAVATLIANYSYLQYTQRRLIDDFLKTIKGNPQLLNSLQEFAQNQKISSVPMVGEALLAIKDKKEEDWLARLNQVKALAESSRQVAMDPYLEKENGLKEFLYKLGYHYYHETTVRSNCENYAGKIGGDIELIKILTKWTFDQLEQDLIVDSEDNFGGDLAMLLAKVAANHQEIFQSVVNKKIALRILPDVISYHSWYTARGGAIELLSHLKILNSTILECVVKALSDVNIVREKAVVSLNGYTEIVDRKTIDKLEKILNGPNGQVSKEMTRLLANISAQSALDTDLRKTTINILAKTLREQINEPSKRKLLYNFSLWQVSLFNLNSNIQYLGRFEDTLYDELVKLAGL